MLNGRSFSWRRGIGWWCEWDYEGYYSLRRQVHLPPPTSDFIYEYILVQSWILFFSQRHCLLLAWSIFVSGTLKGRTDLWRGLSMWGSCRMLLLDTATLYVLRISLTPLPPFECSCLCGVHCNVWVCSEASFHRSLPPREACAHHGWRLGHRPSLSGIQLIILYSFNYRKGLPDSEHVMTFDRYILYILCRSVKPVPERSRLVVVTV